MTKEVEPSGSFDPELFEFYRDRIKELDNHVIEDLSEYSYIFNNPDNITKQTDEEYEIYINITASLLKSVNQNYLPSETQTICANTYHIPVPSGQDYGIYVKDFFDYVEKCMISSAQEVNIPTKNNE